MNRIHFDLPVKQDILDKLHCTFSCCTPIVASFVTTPGPHGVLDNMHNSMGYFYKFIYHSELKLPLINIFMKNPYRIYMDVSTDI